MGCCSSSPASAEAGKARRKSSSERPGLMHTNSMLFPKEAMEEAKKSLRLPKPISEGDEPFEPQFHGILVPSENGFELGQEIEYAKEMTETMEVTMEIHSSEKPEDAEQDEPAQATKKILFGYKTLQGRSGMAPNKPNQDSVVVFKLEGKPNHVVFGVFDGHGPFGEHAAHFCRMQLHKTMLEIYNERGDDLPPEDLLNDSILRIHEDFIKTNPNYSGVDPVVSGTTLVVALVKDDLVYVANVGDSRCILGHRSADDPSKAQVVAMSDDHKPERDSERARLLKTEAILMTEGQLRGGSKEEGKLYICRAKNGQISYGVLFTRSIGDLDAHNYLGILSQPEFKCVKVEKKLEQYLVLASDGIWDQMTNEQVMRKVFQTGDPLKASETIAMIAKERWDNDRTHARRDDITVCVVRLN